LVELIKSSEQWGRKALSSILIEALNASIVKVQAINKLNNSSNDL